MANPQLRDLARRLANLEKQALNAKQPTLGHSSIDGGALQANDDDGNQTMIIGEQFDGTHTAATIIGPTPPTPNPALITPGPGALRIYWDGTWVGGEVAPMDFARVTAHAVPASQYTGVDPLDQRWVVGSYAALGGEITVSAPEEEHYVYLVAWSQAGKFGDASSLAFGTPNTVGGASSDGVAPSTAVAVAVSGGSDYLSISWTESNNADPVTYRVHLAAGAAPAIDGSAEVAAGVGMTTATVRLLKNGTPIQHGTTYYAIVTIEDPDGPGPASAPATGALTSLPVEAIPDETQAQIDGVTTIYRTTSPPWANGTTQPASRDGDEWHDTDNGNLAHKWNGALKSWVPHTIGKTATANDVIAGKTVPIGELTELQWGVYDPLTAPDVSSASQAPYQVPPAPDGHARTAGRAAFFRESGGTFWGLYPNPGDPQLMEIHKWTAGATTRTIVATVDPRISHTTYSLPSAGWSEGEPTLVVTDGKLYISYKFEDVCYVHSGTTGAYESKFFFANLGATPTDGSSVVEGGSGLHTDGTTIWKVRRVALTAGGYRIEMMRYNTTGALQQTLTLTGAGFSDYEVNGAMVVGDFDYGAGRIVFSREEVSRVFSLADGSHISAETFTGGELQTLWDGSNFLFPENFLFLNDGPTDDPDSWLRTTRDGSPTSQNARFVYTYADTSTDGTGLHESGRSPITTFTIPARSTIFVSGSGLPDGITVDQPDCYYVYASIDNGPWYRQSPRNPQDPAAPERVLDPFSKIEFLPPMKTVGAQAPTASNFPQGDSGTFAAESGGFYVRGDSIGAWPHLEDRLREEFDSRYSFDGHDHLFEYAAYVHNHDSKYAGKSYEATVDSLSSTVSNSPFFEGVRSTSQSIPNAAWTKIVFDGTPVAENGLTFNATTNEVTIGASGIYTLTAQVSFGSNSTGVRYCRIMRNGTEMIGYQSIAAHGGVATPGKTRTMKLSAGDKIHLEAHQNSGGSLNTVAGQTEYTHLSISRAL